MGVTSAFVERGVLFKRFYILNFLQCIILVIYFSFGVYLKNVVCVVNLLVQQVWIRYVPFL
jgi:hypothetical protein